MKFVVGVTLNSMTVCIAAKANNGKALVLAADQMATMAHIGREAESSHKILKLTENVFLLSAGNEFSAREIYKASVARASNIETVDDARDIVKSEYVTARLTAFQAQFLHPRGLDIQTYLQSQQALDKNIVSLIDQQMLQFSFGVSLIVAGINPNGDAQIYVIEDPGIFGEEDTFTSIGSGGSYATNSLLARGYQASQSETEATYLVFEAKKRSEVASGVGVKTDLTVLNEQGLRVYAEAELDDLNNFYKDYVGEERKLLEDKLKMKFNKRGKAKKGQ